MLAVTGVFATGAESRSATPVIFPHAARVTVLLDANASTPTIAKPCGSAAKTAVALDAVKIENRPAEEVLRRFDTPQTLFYVDPPYLPETRSTAHPARYKYELSVDDHVRLAGVLHSLDGMVIISGYASDLYNDLFAGWTRLSKSTTAQGNATTLEYLWLSPTATELGKMPLFAGSRLEETG